MLFIVKKIIIINCKNKKKLLWNLFIYQSILLLMESVQPYRRGLEYVDRIHAEVVALVWH